MKTQADLSITGQQFIGAERSAEGTAELVSRRADNGQSTSHRFYQATLAEVHRAARAAEQAFPVYSQTSAEQRAAFLDAIADELESLSAAFITLVSQETALPEARILSERGRTCTQLRLFAQVVRRGDFYGARIDTALPERHPLPRPDLRQYQVALGPVAVFGASNFPLAFSTLGGDTAAALAAGCPVVFKAHSGHMATADCVAQAVLRAAQRQRMVPGVFNMIFGSRVGADLVRHPAIQAVGFTGSLAGGRALIEIAQQRPQPIPVFAEMSSINPVVILPQALAARGEQIAQELTASFTLGCGQFCTKPGLVLVVRSPASAAFISALAEATTGVSPQVMLNAGTLDSYQQGVARLVQQQGLACLAQGEPGTAQQARAQLWQADIGLLLTQHPLLQEEVFGPLTLVVEAESEAQLQQAIERLQGQLTATLIGEPRELAEVSVLSQQLLCKAGRLLFNAYPTGVEVCDAMVHGGPYPATSDARMTSVGTLAIERFLRPVCFQNSPQALLPAALQDSNPLGLLRLVNGRYSCDPL